jgi:hypothetical protein
MKSRNEQKIVTIHQLILVLTFELPIRVVDQN